MLAHPTLDKLNAMGLTGMAKAFHDLITHGESEQLSHACALGHKACRDDRSVLYQRVPRLFANLALAHGDGRYARLQRTLGNVQLLILDDWGLEPLNEQARHDLLEILEDRCGRRSTIITSQLPVSAWHDFIGHPTYADAILDRLVHNAHRIDLSGDSLRRNQPRKS